MSDTEASNRQFYDRLYGRRSAVGQLFRAFISFDQRSKTAPNLEMLEQVITHSAQRPRNANLRLLDYGCGWGTLLLALRHRSLELYGFDLSPQAVGAVARAAALVGERVCDAPRDEDGRLCANFFDIVVCSHVLEHVGDDVGLLREFRRALRNGGHLLLNVPINEVVADPKHVRAYTEASICDLVSSARFHVLTVRAVDRCTAFLLLSAARSRLPGRVGVRLLRGALALLPWKLTEWIGDRLLGHGYPRQQYLMLCRAAS